MEGQNSLDRDGIAALDTPRAEDVGDTADLVEELTVGDLTRVGGLVGLVDDGNLVGVLVVVAVNTVVGRVERTLRARMSATGVTAIEAAACERK